jgi:ribosomal protein L12E/L44/L45/RPP1/RPP2
MPPKKSAGTKWTTPQKVAVYRWLRDHPDIDRKEIGSSLASVLTSRNPGAITTWSRKLKTADLDRLIAQAQKQIMATTAGSGGGAEAVQAAIQARAALSPEVQQITFMMQGMNEQKKAEFLDYIRSFGRARGGGGGGGGGGGCGCGGGAEPEPEIDRYAGLSMAQKMFKKSLEEMAKDPRNRLGMTAQQYVETKMKSVFRAPPSSQRRSPSQGPPPIKMPSNLLASIRKEPAVIAQAGGGGGAPAGMNALLASIRRMKVSAKQKEEGDDDEWKEED